MSFLNNELLLSAIEIKRKELIHLGKTSCLTTEDVVKCSQDLDKLLNTYQKYLEANKQKKPQ